MSLTHYCINHADIVIEYLPTEIVILHLRSMHYYTLPILARQIWLMWEQGASNEAIITTIAKHYRHREIIVMTDLFNFTQKLLSEKLIITAPSVSVPTPISISPQLERILKNDAHFGWDYSSPTIHRYEENSGLLMLNSQHAQTLSPTIFWQELIHHFLHASQQTRPIEKYYKIAGYSLRLLFLDERFANIITPALAHLECAQRDAADLTIHIWDSQSLKQPQINYAWQSYDYTLRGEIHGLNNQDFYTIVDIHTKALTMLNRKDNIACYWINDVNDLPWWVSGSPLQQIIHWWMQDRGLQLTHAAAIGYAEGGVLLAGRGGSGKSTTTLACLQANMHYVSEDYCLLSAVPQPQAYCVYNSAKLEDQSLAFFPELKQYVANVERAQGDKAFLFQQQFQPEKISLKMPMKAIVVLKIGNEKSSHLKPISPAEALPALALSTVWQLTHSGRKAVQYLKTITTSLPCYLLELGSDIQQIPKKIEQLL